MVDSGDDGGQVPDHYAASGFGPVERLLFALFIIGSATFFWLPGYRAYQLEQQHAQVREQGQRVQGWVRTIIKRGYHKNRGFRVEVQVEWDEPGGDRAPGTHRSATFLGDGDWRSRAIDSGCKTGRDTYLFARPQETRAQRAQFQEQTRGGCEGKHYAALPLTLHYMPGAPTVVVAKDGMYKAFRILLFDIFLLLGALWSLAYVLRAMFGRGPQSIQGILRSRRNL